MLFLSFLLFLDRFGWLRVVGVVCVGFVVIVFVIVLRLTCAWLLCLVV